MSTSRSAPTSCSATAICATTAPAIAKVCRSASSSTGRSGQLGMTCAACHTGQLEYQKDGATHALRLDGAPAAADFQQFLTDLTAAARATLAQPDRFTAFAKAVLGSGSTPAKAAQLRTDFGAWVKQFGDFMDASLPLVALGPGTARRVRHDLQPGRRARSRRPRQFQASPTHRSATPSCGTPRARTTRSGTAACPTGSLSRRWPATRARCSASSPTSSRQLAVPATVLFPAVIDYTRPIRRISTGCKRSRRKSRR